MTNINSFNNNNFTIQLIKQGEEESAKDVPAEVVSLHGDFVAVAIIFTVGIIGLIANFFSLRIIYKIPALHNCFGYLCFIHALGEAGVLAIFVFWATSMAIITSNLSNSYIGIKFGHLILIFYFITLYAQLLKAINRLLAIGSPLLYRNLFKDSNAKYFVGLVITVSLLHGIVYFFDGCNFYFDSSTLVWTFEISSCGEIISFYIDFIFGCSFMLFVIFIDVCTLITIHHNRQILGLGQAQKSKQAKKEIRFFVQACLTSILYTVMLASFHLVWRFDTNPWHVFLSTSIAWELCHALDAILMIAFNAKLRKHSPGVSKVQSMKSMATRSVGDFQTVRIVS